MYLDHPHYALYVAHKLNPNIPIWVYGPTYKDWVCTRNAPRWLTHRSYAVSVEKPTWTPNQTNT